MKPRRLGIWLVGARGSVSATVVVGAMALRRGLIPETGMVTAAPAFSGMELAPVGEVEFGGCDVRRGSILETAYHLFEETRAIDLRILEAVKEDVLRVEAEIKEGTAHNCGDTIEALAGRTRRDRPALLQEVNTVRRHLRRFRREKDLAEVVVLNLASTEPPLELHDYHCDVHAFEAGLKTNRADSCRASTLYSYAAILEGCPYINFTPSNGALVPALIELATRKGVPVMGNDGKTGETLVKSALAPMFLCRNLEIMSWEGFNLLGNMDGKVLDHPDNRRSKLKTKDQILPKILGYAPHSRVHIHYVPSLDDQKTAWDFVHFKGFLGARMAFQFVWQGYDSLLAAPLVLDLARMAEYAKRRGESGLMPHLASFFKDPLGVEEHHLSSQFAMLLDYVRKATAGGSGRARRQEPALKAHAPATIALENGRA
jgi:myo-inositol-1-phosphate synthase